MADGLTERFPTGYQHVPCAEHVHSHLLVLVRDIIRSDIYRFTVSPTYVTRYLVFILMFARSRRVH